MFVLFKPFFDILAKAGAVGFYQYRKIFDIVLAFGHVLTKKNVGKTDSILLFYDL